MSEKNLEERADGQDTQLSATPVIVSGMKMKSQALQSGLSSLGPAAETQMMQAINVQKQTQNQEILIRARIVKLQKEEEKAQKRIKDMTRRNKFVQDMHDFKNDKMNNHQNLRANQKFVEDQNRGIFNNMRATSTNNIKSNRFSVKNRNHSQFQSIKAEKAQIEDRIGRNRDNDLKNLQNQYKSVKDGQNFAKSNMRQMNSTMMDKNSSFYNERINNTHTATQQVSQTNDVLQKQEEELIARLQKTYANEQKTIMLLSDTVKKSPVRHTQMKADAVEDFLFKPNMVIKKQMPIGMGLDRSQSTQQ